LVLVYISAPSTNNAAPADGAGVSEFHQEHSLARETMHDLAIDDWNSESAYGREREKAKASHSGV